MIDASVMIAFIGMSVVSNVTLYRTFKHISLVNEEKVIKTN